VGYILFYGDFNLIFGIKRWPVKRVDCSTSKQVSCSVTGKHRTDQSHWTKVGHDSRSSLRHQLSHLIYVCMLLSSQDIALLDSRNKGVFVNFGRCI